MNTPPGPARGSTPSRRRGAIALRAAAALCAGAAALSLLVMLFITTLERLGRPAAFGALAVALGLIAVLLYLAARESATREDLRRARLDAQAAASAQKSPREPLDLGPYIRVISAALPLLTALAAVVGPFRLVRWMLRLYAMWRAYETPSPSSAAQPASSQANTAAPNREPSPV